MCVLVCQLSKLGGCPLLGSYLQHNLSIGTASHVIRVSAIRVFVNREFIVRVDHYYTSHITYWHSKNLNYQHEYIISLPVVLYYITFAGYVGGAVGVKITHEHQTKCFEYCSDWRRHIHYWWL